MGHGWIGFLWEGGACEPSTPRKHGKDRLPKSIHVRMDLLSSALDRGRRVAAVGRGAARDPAEGGRSGTPRWDSSLKEGSVDARAGADACQTRNENSRRGGGGWVAYLAAAREKSEEHLHRSRGVASVLRDGGCADQAAAGEESKRRGLGRLLRRKKNHACLGRTRSRQRVLLGRMRSQKARALDITRPA